MTKVRCWGSASFQTSTLSLKAQKTSKSMPFEMVFPPGVQKENPPALGNRYTFGHTQGAWLSGKLVHIWYRNFLKLTKTHIHMPF